MAIGDIQNFQIYQDEFFGGMSEVLAQNADAFNAASNNAIRLITQRSRGDYQKESFFQAITASNLTPRRDVESTAGLTDQPLTQGEVVSVKLNRRIGPIADTIDAFRKVAPDQDAQRLFSFQLGQQISKGVQLDRLESALMAVEAALDGQTALEFDASGGILQFTDLVDGLAKMGDRGNAVRTWVMHSKVFYDLMKDGMANYKVDTVAGATIVNGASAAMGRTVVVTDSSNLIITGTPDNYVTLGLVEDAVTVMDSEEQELQTDLVTGLENLVLRIQGEYAYNVGVKGFKWDVTNGGRNPTNANLTTSTNWDLAAADTRDCAGVRIWSQ